MSTQEDQIDSEIDSLLRIPPHFTQAARLELRHSLRIVLRYITHSGTRCMWIGNINFGIRNAIRAHPDVYGSLPVRYPITFVRRSRSIQLARAMDDVVDLTEDGDAAASSRTHGSINRRYTLPGPDASSNQTFDSLAHSLPIHAGNGDYVHSTWIDFTSHTPRLQSSHGYSRQAVPD